ncbi:MAG: hypothetical protein IPM29_28425 [Planctomycetes bacterium]|nr:hypothetical protein [Planctomycetota bacterium]
MDHPDPGTFPDLAPAEPARFATAFRHAIETLEAAVPTGELTHRLADPDLSLAVGPRVVDAYRRLGPARRSDPRRAVCVRQLVDRLCADSFDVTVRGEAEPLPDGSFRARLPRGAARILRLDQLDRLSFWGIGFEIADPAAHASLLRGQVERAVARFADDLLDLQRILRRRTTFPLALVPARDYRRFEHLVLDILNEHRHRADAARLEEDYCQVTDLRVRYEDLGRRNGARVQVKATAHVARHEQWLERTRRRELLVILSPVTLAERLESAPLAPLHRDVWRQLGTRPEDRQQLAYALREVLFAGLADPTADALGPLAAVAEPVRRLVREFVRDRAFGSTAALRQFEARGDGYRAGRDGRLVWRSAAALA